MKERPILMSAPMVRACMREINPKGVTRRIIKPQPVDGDTIFKKSMELGWIVGQLRDSENAWRDLKCPYGRPGDRLWVRETWCLHHEERAVAGFAATDDALKVAESGERNADGGPRWRPSIFMPRWASRLTLEVTDVSAERLQDISEDDAIREGACWHDFGRQCGHFGGWRDVGECKSEFHPQRNGWTMEPPAPGPDHCHGSARMAFANLINKINGPETWDANPWVWAVSFKRVEAP